MKKKTCISCRATMPLNRDNFYFRKDTEKFFNECKKCSYIRSRRNLLNKPKPEYCPKKNKAYKVQHRYGITLEEYDKLLDTPCDICGDKATVCDHDHNTGKVRGGLCNGCNVLLGLIERKDIEVTYKALKYLEKHNV